ncbi:hypothetical protein B0H13DRAFT_2359590 [Mycena leptocephala]|nr:hypothetical protein B0H13DRAFT_2359590 [Mycena leptocephala]
MREKTVVDALFSVLEQFGVLQNRQGDALFYVLESHQVPRDDELKFRDCAKVLVDKWRQIDPHSLEISEDPSQVSIIPEYEFLAPAVYQRAFAREPQAFGPGGRYPAELETGPHQRHGRYPRAMQHNSGFSRRFGHERVQTPRMHLRGPAQRVQAFVHLHVLRERGGLA